MARKLFLCAAVALLLILPVISAAAADQGVSDLRGQWIFNWTLADGTNPWPLYILINDVQPGEAANSFLAAGCMRSPYSGEILPLALTATYHPIQKTYDWTIYATYVPSQRPEQPPGVGGPPFLMRFDGLAQMYGAGVSDDTAAGTFMSNNYQGVWSGRHHDRRYFDCPPVELNDGQLDMDVYAYSDLGGFEGQQMMLEGRGITIVSSAMRVTAPDGQVFTVPSYTDIFSPNADFISEFRFAMGYPGAPIPSQPYKFVLLDVMGQPIPGTETQDVWTQCYNDAPSGLATLPNPAFGVDVNLTWTGVPTVLGEFEPGTIGFYQIGLWPQNGPGTEFGANWIGATNHIIPWQPFDPDSVGVPDGYNLGVSLSELQDGEYGLAVMAFYQPNPSSDGRGLECFVTDNRENLRMVKSGTELMFGPMNQP